MSNSVFLLPLLDSDGSTCKNNCMKSNKHRPVLSVAKNVVCGNINYLSRNVLKKPKTEVVWFKSTNLQFSRYYLRKFRK